MREIKFRVWDKEEDVMYQNGSFTLEVLGKFVSVYVKAKPYIRELIDYKLMQYTGLKDKNGKEIYEGDIVKFRNKYISKVEYSNTQGFIVRFKQAGLHHCINIFSTDSDIEVIGNIYENEDLLEK